MHSLQQVVWVAGLALAAALVVKLAVTGLFRVYAWFSTFLCFEIVRSLVLFQISQATETYAWIFLITQPFTWLLYVLVVFELYSVALRAHRGVATLSQWTLSVSLAIAVGISALTLRADLSRPVGPYPMLDYYNVIERGLFFSLALFLLLTTVFLAWFPLTVSRNIRLHASVYFIYVLSSTLAIFLLNVAGRTAGPGVDLTLMFLNVVCFALWLGGLSRRGEEQLVLRRKWQPEDEDRLMRHLDELSAAVLKRPRG
jgi:hypothetical protein